jgi:hypothetical protein
MAAVILAVGEAGGELPPAEGISSSSHRTSPGGGLPSPFRSVSAIAPMGVSRVVCADPRGRWAQVGHSRSNRL